MAVGIEFTSIKKIEIPLQPSPDSSGILLLFPLKSKRYSE